MAETILLVDDDAQLLHVTQMLFDLEGYNVVVAKNGQQAMETLTQVRPDVIMLDVIMPEVDGVEVCRRIRADPKLRAIPIAVFTAAEMREKDLRDVGADRFIVKPYTIDGLRDVARELIDQARAKASSKKSR